MVRYGVVQPTQIDSIPEGIITLYKRINAGIRQHFNLHLDETDIDNILFKRNTQYPEKVLRRTFEMAKDYLVELLGKFFRTGNRHSYNGGSFRGWRIDSFNRPY